MPPQRYQHALLAWVFACAPCISQADAAELANAQDSPAPQAPGAAADSRGDGEPEAWNAHGQFTFVDQFTRVFDPRARAPTG
jgi:hypothetical protein